jgi:hypothetical protein
VTDAIPRYHRQRWAQLRLQVIGHSLAAPPAPGALQAQLTALAQRTWRNPVSGLDVRFGLSTIERWYALARKSDDPTTQLTAALVNETVTLRFDPATPAARGIQVYKDSAFIGIAKPVDAYANCFVRRNRPSRNFDTDPLAPPAPANSTASAPARVAPSSLRLHTLIKPNAAASTSAPDCTTDPGANPPCTSRTSD